MKNSKNLITPIERYNPSINEGLSLEQVNNRIKEKNVNVCDKKYSKSVLNIFFENIFSFFNLLGLIVTIALIIAKAKFSSFFFDVIFASNTIIGIVQELRAKITIDKLSLISLSTIKVIRNSETISIPSKDIVLDDILYLGIGNQIPTDSIVLEGIVEVNESLLTGETVAVKKQKGDELFAGSFIVSGTCKAKANKVGKENYISKLSEKAKKYKKPHSEIMSSLKAIIKAIGLVIVPFAILYIVKSQLKDGDIYYAIQMTSSVIIGMIPSGMFLLTSVALAVGVIKLSKRNTLVQDLYSLEMLARVDTMCFDKTGTITDGRMSVREFVKLDMSFEISIDKIMSSMLNALKDTNQTATALYEKFGYSEEYNSINVLHFNSEKKLSAVTFENIGTFAFGAPEFILSKEEYSKINTIIDNYAKMGLRVILLAKSNKNIENDNIGNDFFPIGLIILN
ncbi:MAG: HAD-IC family P-type ATPase, partial [Firmicutes bacterium]|nr:HAD-IC family P-type ATPase [Candidatus Caballimonas caccae]